MAAVEELPTLSLWEQICAEFEAEQPLHPDSPEQKLEPLLPPPPEPLFLPEPSLIKRMKEAGRPKWVGEFPLDAEPALGGDQNELVPIEESLPQEIPLLFAVPPTPEAPDLKTCSPREFLEHYIFPVLLPGMTELLHQAKKEKCFERKRTRFIALDFLTEWLYNHNPKREEEPFVEFFEIPFVKDWLKDHPRPPIPLSLLLTEEEAGNIIQSFWRGYRIRCEPEVQELRQWQKHLRETKNIIRRVKEFWIKQEKKVGTKMEDSVQPSPDRSRVSVAAPWPTPTNVEVKEVEITDGQLQ